MKAGSALSRAATAVSPIGLELSRVLTRFVLELVHRAYYAAVGVARIPALVAVAPVKALLRLWSTPI